MVCQLVEIELGIIFLMLSCVPVDNRLKCGQNTERWLGLTTTTDQCGQSILHTYNTVTLRTGIQRRGVTRREGNTDHLKSFHTCACLDM